MSKRYSVKRLVAKHDAPLALVGEMMILEYAMGQKIKEAEALTLSLKSLQTRLRELYEKLKQQQGEPNV